MGLRAHVTAMLDASSRLVLAGAVRLGRRLTRRRFARGTLRTMWGVTPIVTLPLKARADQRLGFASESVVFTTYYITSDFTWNLHRLVSWGRLWLAGYPPFCRLLLAIALLRYDIIHLFADRGLMPPVDGRFGLAPEELDAYAAAGKPAYVFAYGADVRTRQATLALGRWNFCRDCPEIGRYCVCSDGDGRRRMEETARRATALVSCGDMLTYMPTAQHIAYWPVDLDRIRATPMPDRAGRATLRLAHAPNHMHFKGTRYLEESIARLGARGIDIELVKVSGVPNERVLALFETCDVVADQFIGGAYGYTALEGLAAGRPVITFVRAQGLVEAVQECPFLNATPDSLDDCLTWCAANRSVLAAIGRQGRAYVARHHSIDAVAARLAGLYRDTIDTPAPLRARLDAFCAAEATRKAGVGLVEDWTHPFLLSRSGAARV